MKGRPRDAFWLGLLVLVMIIVGALTLDTQPRLSPDDHGKDLYGFEMFLKGQWPCRDYWWQYGPLMLFYYAFWLFAGGVNLLSIRMGLGFLYLFSSIVTYRALRLFVSPLIAFLASLAFLIQWLVYPYYNFNHVGALPLVLFSLFSLWKFFLTHRIRWCYAGLFAVVGIALIKINVGLTSFVAFFGSLVFYLILSKFRWTEELVDFPKKHFIILPLIFGGVVSAAYLLMYAGYPVTYVDQCLGMRKIYGPQFDSFRDSLIHFPQWFLVWDRRRLWWVTLCLVFGVLGLLGFRRVNPTGIQKKVFYAALASLFLYELCNAVTEYFLLVLIYRFDFWTFPVLVLLMGLCAHWAKSLFNRRTRAFLGGLIFLIVIGLPLLNIRKAHAMRIPERYLDFERGRVYFVEENLSTVEAIKKGTRFIIENTKPGEEILAVPIAPLYCFLSGRPHAVRELFFAENARIRDWQEERIIGQLEAKQTPLFVLSNLDNQAPNMGEFGKTHLQKLGRYLFGRYREVQKFGDPWEVPNARRSHACKIFQRQNN